MSEARRKGRREREEMSRGGELKAKKPTGREDEKRDSVNKKEGKFTRGREVNYFDHFPGIVTSYLIRL